MEHEPRMILGNNWKPGFLVRSDDYISNFELAACLIVRRFPLQTALGRLPSTGSLQFVKLPRSASGDGRPSIPDPLPFHRFISPRPPRHSAAFFPSRDRRFDKQANRMAAGEGERKNREREERKTAGVAYRTAKRVSLPRRAEMND